MSQFINKNFPTFKKWFIRSKDENGILKKRRFWRSLFLIVVFIAAVIIIKDEINYQFGLGFWSDSSMDEYYDDADGQDTESYCAADDNVKGIVLTGSLQTYIPDPYFEDPTLLDDTMTASENIVYQIDSADKDEQIKAIVLEIDCFGGDATAAKEIADALKRAQKPTVALIRSYGTSACYWVATGADAIFANTTSNVGSIGVTMSYLDYSGKNTKEGITYQQIASAKFKDYGNPDKPLTLEEKNILQKEVNDLHNIFVSEVAVNRNLNLETVNKLADGTSMYGQAALDIGLIDFVGDQSTVEEYLQEKLGDEVSICW